VRLSIWVRPRASHPAVGGQRDGALVVAVHEPAVDGRATAAALAAVADALGVRPGRVRLVSGTSARTKVLEVDGDEVALAERLAALVAGADGATGPQPTRSA
jgi:hypothetical protein